MKDFEHVPVFGICGYSGAGKTTLILEIVRRLRARGLATLVIKHDTHGLTIDRPGKDSQRFFAAGADVMARDEEQSFVRLHRLHRAHLHLNDSEDLADLVHLAQRSYDVILVEGHKTTPLPHKLWLRRHARDRAPRACLPVDLDLRRDQDRVTAAWAWIEPALARIHRAAPTLAGILIGGASQRMGKSKHLLIDRGRTWLAHIVAAAMPVTDGVVLLGRGHVPRSCALLPRLPDAPGLAGPLAGMCAALRWRSDARWIFLACDSPRVTSDALRWLKAQARPGVWAVQPRLSASQSPDPLPGWYDFRAASALESARGPSWLAQHPRTATPVLPDELATAWLNCNTPADLRRLGARSAVTWGTTGKRA
jgi:molybdopterin-guanine dinucleotide biosynthesis protein MobB